MAVWVPAKWQKEKLPGLLGNGHMEETVRVIRLWELGFSTPCETAGNCMLTSQPHCVQCVEPAFLPNLSLHQCQQHPPCRVGQTTSVICVDHGYLSGSGFPSVHCNLNLREFGFIFTSSLPRELRGRLRILWAPSISQERPLDLLLKIQEATNADISELWFLMPRIWA